MYVNDYDQKFTLGYDPAVGWLSYFDWIGKMDPYFQDEKLFTCPSAKKYDSMDVITRQGIDTKYGKKNEAWWYKKATQTEPELVGSYGMNLWINTVVGTPSYGDLKMYLQKATSPTGISLSNVPLFMDCMWFGGYPFDTDRPSTNEDVIDQYGHMSRFAVKRHRSGVNAVFLDMSASEVYIKDLWGLKWHKEFSTGNNMRQANAVWPPWVDKND